MAAIFLAQEVVEAAGAMEFRPTLLGLIVLLPFLGFVINGLAAIVAARKARPGGTPAHDLDDPSEQEAEADDHDLHPAGHDHDHSGPRPWTHVLPSFVAPGVT